MQQGKCSFRTTIVLLFLVFIAFVVFLNLFLNQRAKTTAILQQLQKLQKQVDQEAAKTIEVKEESEVEAKKETAEVQDWKKNLPSQPRDKTIFVSDSSFLRIMVQRFDLYCAHYGNAEWARPFGYGRYNEGEWFLCSNIDGKLNLFLSKDLSPAQVVKAVSKEWEAGNEDKSGFGVVSGCFPWSGKYSNGCDVVDEAIKNINNVLTLSLQVVEYLN